MPDRVPEVGKDSTRPRALHDRGIARYWVRAALLGVMYGFIEAVGVEPAIATKKVEPSRLFSVRRLGILVWRSTVL